MFSHKKCLAITAIAASAIIATGCVVNPNGQPNRYGNYPNNPGNYNNQGNYGNTGGYNNQGGYNNPGNYNNAPAHNNANNAAHGGMPFFNATCPGNIEVHADQGGPVYFNGQQTRLKKVNNNYFEANGSGITLSIAINPDGSPNLTYTGRHGANGVCQLSQ